MILSHCPSHPLHNIAIAFRGGRQKTRSISYNASAPDDDFDGDEPENDDDADNFDYKPIKPSLAVGALSGQSNKTESVSRTENGSRLVPAEPAAIKLVPAIKKRRVLYFLLIISNYFLR